MSVSLVRVKLPGEIVRLGGCAGGRRRFRGTPVREKVKRFIDINLQGKTPGVCSRILRKLESLKKSQI